MSIVPCVRRSEGLDPFGTMRRSVEGKRAARNQDYVRGWWENIDKEPIFIEDKEHLKRECQRRGLIPKMFAKEKSQGKGLEWSY